MRWFKHMTRAHTDERLARFRERAGIGGYGLYWLLVEIIAGEMGPRETNASASYSVRNWTKLLDVRPSFFRKHISSCQGVGLISFETRDDLITISIPNILKYRDEYSEKSGVRRDKVGSNSGLTPLRSESETERETERELNRGVPPVLGGEKDKQDMQPVSESLKHFRKLAEKHTR